MVRTRLVTCAALVLLAGCGGDGEPRAAGSATPTRTATAEARAAAPELVFFQRQGAAGATLDTFTVRSDGTARLEKRYGGAGGRFKDLRLRAGQLPRLKAALAHLPRGSLGHGTAPPGGATTYIIRYRGRTLSGLKKGLDARARPAVKQLDGFIDGIGVTRATRENATHEP
jgi:hypothetical protein